MLEFLAKRWFLVLLLVGVSLAALWPEWIGLATSWVLVDAVVPAALFLIACGLESRSLLHRVVRPWPALWASCLSYGLVPTLAWLAGRLVDNPEIRVGLMIAASAPCTLA